MIRAEALSKSYGAGPGVIEAVRAISFEAREGEIFGLVGPNGAGKSTTVKILVTLLRPSGGRAMVGGHDVTLEPHEVRRSIGVALQETGLDESQSGRELLEMHGRLAGLDGPRAAARASELLLTARLEDAGDRRIATYSGGMRRQLDLGLALVARPGIVFLDEPTAGLDPVARRGIWEEIADLRDHGTTILLTTQYLDEADRLCDRLAIIDRGEIVAVGSPRDLRRSIGGDVIELELADEDAAASLASAISNSAVQGRVLRTTGEDGPARVPALLREAEQRGFAVSELRMAEPSLEDAFIALTGRRLEGDGPGGDEAI
jgi:ABC-2 type transport system ATP-binding protein